MNGGTGTRVELIGGRGDGESSIQRFVCGLQCRFVGSLDAHQHVLEPSLTQQIHDLRVLGHIERDRGGQLERVVVLLEPFCETPQEGLRLSHVAHQIVIEEVQLTAITQTVELVELDKDLLQGLGAVLELE